ncbi:DNA primase small subunit [Cladophialophora psammophila CBS 110553]|uniref:DNA primase n=1 Tax=Cladophialophora psammophila CBS 110553 TaxID=1182543 RepID=W9X8E0_9EURO|nr:DNA primase small subunit [Cladophialophora psammophila CBS 110553]EXJ73595.1 DNA primase small subunit [Cladophialophora psammophila CBS 110553]
MAGDSSPHQLSPSQNEDLNLPNAPPAPGVDRDGIEDDTVVKSENQPPVSLEDLFEGGGDDDDLGSGVPTSSEANIPSSPPESAPGSSENATATLQQESYSDPAIMKQFYARLFPFRALFQWLNHSPKPGPDFTNREFALTLPNDAYLRYQSYPTADLLRKDILQHIPSRFEIGPVYTTNPRERKTLRNSSMLRPLSKEIVFDIDLTDYDDIRTCCEKANICSKCWSFATMAIKVVDVALREDFGFEHIIWIYSGRRGVHAWISDKKARKLDDDKRKAITGYFEVLKGGVQGGKRVNLKRPLHPHIARSLEILKPYFQQVLIDQDPFMSQKGQDRLLQLLPDKALNEALVKKWSSSPDRPSIRKWEDIDALAKTGVSKTLDTKALVEAKQDILLEYTYPRLDVEVGKKRIHLLKSPFVVHPGTGRVCVPITAGGDMSRAESFDPLSVPKLNELLREVDQFGSNDEPDERANGYIEDGVTMRKLNDWEKTSLKPYVELFDAFVKSLLKSEMVRVKRERDEDGVTGADGMEF